MFKIQVRWSNGNISDFMVNKDCAVLGRSPDSDVYLPSELASREHAKVYRQGDQTLIEDMQSANGTFIRNESIKLPTEITPEVPVKLADVYVRVTYMDPNNLPKHFVEDTGSYSISQRLGDRKMTGVLGVDPSLREMIQNADKPPKKSKK